jgi:hypothetical protein
MQEKQSPSFAENGHVRPVVKVSPSNGLGEQVYMSVQLANRAIFGPSHSGPIYIQLMKVSGHYRKIGTISVKSSVENRGSGRIWRLSNAIPKGRIYPTFTSCQCVPRQWSVTTWLNPSRIWRIKLDLGIWQLKNL